MYQSRRILGLIGINGGNEISGAVEGYGEKELDGVIANRFYAIEKEMRDMNEWREEESRQIMMALAKLTSQSNHPSTSYAFGKGETQGIVDNQNEQNRPYHQFQKPNY